MNAIYVLYMVNKMEKSDSERWTLNQVITAISMREKCLVSFWNDESVLPMTNIWIEIALADERSILLLSE